MRKEALLLGLASVIEMAAQIVVPMVLARQLTPEGFGSYRLLWLLAGTALAVAPLGMSNSLFYFFPRHEGDKRSIYATQALIFLAISGALTVLVAWIALKALGSAPKMETQFAWFVGVWVLASLQDNLFNALQRNVEQAKLNLGFSLVRIVVVVAAAWFTQSFEVILWGLMGLAAVKAVTCVWLVKRIHPVGTPWVQRDALLDQVRYAAPFGTATMLYLLRPQADQWLVAGMFSTAVFAVFSAATIIAPVQALVRKTIDMVLLPRINRSHAQADFKQALALNNLGNRATALLLFPTLAFVFAMAPVLIELLFTSRYADAAPVMRLYVFTLLASSMEVTTLMASFRQGNYLLKVDAFVLFLSIAVSALGAHLLGLPGAALGGVVGATVAVGASYRRTAQLMKMRIQDLQPWSKLLRFAVASTAAALASAAAGALAPQQPLIRLAAAAAVMLPAYVVALVALGLRTDVLALVKPSGNASA